MKKFISVLLTITMLFSMATAVLAADRPTKEYPQNFWDVPKTHWAFPYIAELVDKGVLAGYEDGSFQPDNTVTRAEWAKIMVLAAGLPASDNNIYFADMANHWANIYVNTAKNYLAAYTDGTFKPDHSAVREDVTVSMVKLKGYDISKVDYSYLNQFTDMNSISNSLKAYVAVAVQKELISGFEDNTFRGQDTLTRAEAATLLWRAFQYGNDNKVVDTPNTTTPVQTPNTPSITPNTTPAPIQTPTPTEKPQQTPDTNITETPEPTPETTPEPTVKPYKIDTIGKANIDNEYFITSNSNDAIYFIENNIVYMVDTKSRTKEEVFNISDLEIDNDEMTLSEFEANSICYDKYQNKLFMRGSYKTVNAVEHVNNSYLYSISKNNADLITDNFYNNYTSKIEPLIAVLSNGDYVTPTCIINSDASSFKDNYIISNIGNVYDVIEAGNKVYYLGARQYTPEGDYFSEYDFTSRNELWKVPVSIGSAGITKDSIVIASDNSLHTYNFKGKETNTITSDDYDVVDRTAVYFNKAFDRLFVLSDNSIIFYDTSAKAFRMITRS